jgi:HlyD family secretion protein
MNSVTAASTAPFTVTVTVTIPPTGTAVSASPTTADDAVPLDVSVTMPDRPAASMSPVKVQAVAETTATPHVAIAAATSPEAQPAANPGPRPETTPARPAVAVSRFEAWKKWLIPGLIIALLVAAAFGAWQLLRPKGPGEGFVSSNGRIEATEIDVSTKFAGRLQDILVADGDFVTAGQTLAHMQVQTLEAQREEARAQRQQSVTAVATAEAQVAARESDRQAMLAVVAQRESELDAAQRRLARSETLTREGASSEQELDDDRARVRNAQAAVVAGRAQSQAAQANITAARAQVAGAHSTVDAADATIVRIKVDIDDSSLTAPRDGRVQYRIAQPGEVLAGGGKVLNLIDLSDVYMTFFVVETVAGKLALGSEVRIVLDAAPKFVIPAKVSFVASSAQFTPKTVETASERQKLMFRVKAQIDRGLLQKNLTQVKTGLPGMAWLKLDSQAEWPAELAVKAGQ